MSRSGYNDDCGGWDLIRWRGAVSSAIKGARGQAFLRELLAALDGMKDKRLIANELKDADGEFCTIGVLGSVRGIDMSKLDPDDREAVADAINIAPALAAEIVFENDEAAWYKEEPEQRWQRMRNWVASQLRTFDETNSPEATDHA